MKWKEIQSGICGQLVCLCITLIPVGLKNITCMEDIVMSRVGEPQGGEIL